MLFLINNVVMNLDPVALFPPMSVRSFDKLSLDFVRRLGCELFAEQPLLQTANPERAKRLCALIAAKSPGVNAALFVAPAFSCPTDQVMTQFAELTFEAIISLYQYQQADQLTHLVVDRQVWRRLAA